MLLELHKQFIREKRYVGNASQNTISFYEYSLRVFSRGFPELINDLSQLTPAILKAAVANLREGANLPPALTPILGG